MMVRVTVLLDDDGDPGAGLPRRHDVAVDADLGFGRTFASDKEAPNLSANLVQRSWPAAQSDNAAKPRADVRVVHALDEVRGDILDVPTELGARLVCPGHKPPFRAVTRRVRPCKRTIENRFMVENAKAA